MQSRQLEKLIAAFQAHQPIRAGSLIITVYGDIIAPRGGAVWLGSLIGLLGPLGLNDRLVRTSVSRLAKDNWLEATQMGRRSYYNITPTGRQRFENATPRIYAGPATKEQESWCLVILNTPEKSKREIARKELGWLGFGAITPTILAHPLPDTTALVQVLDQMGLRDQVIILNKASHELTSEDVLEKMVKDCWNLEELTRNTRIFIDQFTPLYEELCQTAPSEEEAVLMRILLIHEYRKILLRDPLLPTHLLPTDWEGIRAHQLCKNIYQLLLEKSETRLNTSLETTNGPLPDPNPLFYQRFGGIHSK